VYEKVMVALMPGGPVRGTAGQRWFLLVECGSGPLDDLEGLEPGEGPLISVN
jgi:hypothetical protein